MLNHKQLSGIKELHCIEGIIFSAFFRVQFRTSDKEEVKMTHNRLTFTAEYCRARRIPYRIKNEALFIGKKHVCFSLYNLTYKDIIGMIDNECLYDPITTFYIGLA